MLVTASSIHAEVATAQLAVDAKLCVLPPHPRDRPTPSNKARLKAHALLVQATRAYEANNYQQALAALQESFALEPHSDVLYNIAQTCREAGREQESLALYEQTLRTNPSSDVKKESERHINELRPKLAATAEVTGKAAATAKDYMQASKEYARAYALHPLPIYLFRRADALRLAQKWEDAAQFYTQYLAADAGAAEVPTARLQLARILSQRADEQASRHFEAKEYVQAAMAWDAAYHQEPHPLYVFRKAESMYHAGQRNEAKGEYEQFLKISGADLRELRQQAESRLIEIADARRAEDAEAHSKLARILAQRADEEASRHFEAREYVQAVASWEAAYHKEPRAIFVLRKAEALYRAGQQNVAKGEYQKFLKISPSGELHELRQQAQSRLAEIDAQRPVYKRPWFWVAVVGGAAAVAIGVGLGVGLSRGPAPPITPTGVMVYRPGF